MGKDGRCLSDRDANEGLGELSLISLCKRRMFLISAMFYRFLWCFAALGPTSHRQLQPSMDRCPQHPGPTSSGIRPEAHGCYIVRSPRHSGHYSARES